MKVAGLAVLLSCILSSSLSAQSHGRAVIVGGGLSPANEAVYRAILDGRQGSGPLCVIPTASATPDTSARSSMHAFDRHGGPGTARAVMITTARPESAEDSSIVRELRACAGFFFTGGVQSRIVRVLRPAGRESSALAAIRARVAQGAVVSGSSAGAAIMSDPMIAGGTSAAALAGGVRRDVAAPADDDTTSSRWLAVEPGLGFFTAALSDQHFLARGRIGRLVVALLTMPEYDLGFGIDENTALVVEGSRVRAVGASGVVVLDARAARRDSTAAISLALMSTGDSYDLDRRELRIASSKPPLAGTSQPVAAPDDPFARFAFLKLLHAFASGTQATLTLPVAGGSWTLRRGADFDARATTATGVQGVPAGFSVRGLLLDARTAGPRLSHGPMTASATR